MRETGRESESEWQPKREDIEERAYELYLECGCNGGHDLEHWLAAEEELRLEHAQREPVARRRNKTVIAGAGSAQASVRN